MIENPSASLDDRMLLSRINKLQKSSVAKDGSAAAGAVPVSDGNGGVGWGVITPGSLSVIDPDSDGHIEFVFSEGE